MSSEKSFIVVSGGHRFRFTPDSGGYVVSELGVRGVNTQGGSFEEALANAHDASALMAEFREEIRVEDAAAAKACRSAGDRSARSRRRVLAGA
jgi:predicted RNase H-like HicB family nuclease